ncbi:uncharacterized protein LOC134253745, partial [Saccostrea cucullata]|uniref:uncharacterized protein LOC134253745 n=1 Tax=Saccostrea cuccullata TaxID=36930 RepID=UPI002ED10769
MSLSKCHTSTPETTNTARLARLILGPCTDVLRDILKTEVLPSDLSKTVKIFTKSLKYGQRNPFNKAQVEMIFPKPTNQYSGDYSDLDISLLYMLIRNVSNIAAHSNGWGEIPYPGDRSVAANIERIRLIRNQYYGHSADLSLSDSEFRHEWRNIRDIVVELERHLGTSTVYQDAVNEIKTCSMDPEQEKKYIDLLGDIRELHSTVDNLSSNMQKIQRELVLHGKYLVSVSCHDDREMTGNPACHSVNFYTMNRTTKQMIQKHNEAVSSFFIKTRAFDRAKELLDINGYVVIKGNPGTGKTTNAKMLMKELMEEGNSPLQLYKLTDLYGNISPGDGIVVFFDNLFGEFSLNSYDIQEFKAMTEMIQVLIESGVDKKSNRLIFALRNDIYREYVQNECDGDFFLSSVVDLSSKENALLKDEILQLSQKYQLSEYIEDRELINKVFEKPLSIGFPQCCKLARSNEVFKENVSAFFPNPMLFLKDYLKTLMKSRTAKSAALVYLLLSGGEVDFKFIDRSHLDLEMKHASIEFAGLQSSYVNDFQDNIKNDQGANVLQSAASSGDKHAFNLLLEFGCDPLEKDRLSGHTVLTCACQD